MNRFVKFTGYSLQFTEGGCRQRLGGRAARCLLVAALLLGGGMTARAQTYYVFYNATYGYLYNDGGTVKASSSLQFDSTSVWYASGTIGGTNRTIRSKSSSGQYLGNAASLSNTSSNWRGSNNYLCLRSGGSNYYLKATSATAFTTNSTSNSGNRFSYYTVTMTNYPAQLSDFSITGNDVITSTGNYSYSQNATTRSAYVNFRFNSTDHYVNSDNESSNTLPSATAVTTGVTWTLTGDAAGYATFSGNTISVTAIPPTDVVLTLTCSISANGLSKSEQKTVVIQGTKPSAPVISVSGTNVTLSTDAAGSTSFRYTLDGTDPTASTGTVYSGAIDISGSANSPVTIKAVTVRGGNASDVSTEVVTLTLDAPVITVDGAAGTATITAAAGTTIYYTTDGTTPTTSSSQYTGALSGLSPMTTVKAIAVKSGWNNSPVATETVQIPSGTSGGKVTLFDYENHNWTYYAGVDANLDEGNYNTNYLGKMYSPNPRNVKITYRGKNDVAGSSTVVRVSISENDSVFIYHKTLEQGSTSGEYPYQVISNPFSVRPSTGSGSSKVYYGFAGWKIVSGGQYIKNHNNGDVLSLDEEIVFNNLPYPSVNCTSAEIVFQTSWTTANVQSGNNITTMLGNITGGTYETNIAVLTGAYTTAWTGNKNVTVTSVYPDGSSDVRSGSNYTYLNLTLNDGYTIKYEYININDNSTTFTIGTGTKTLYIGRGVSNTTSGSSCCNLIQGCNGNINSGLTYTLKIESGVFGNISFTRGLNTSQSATISGTVNIKSVLGCDYDRAKNDNEKLKFTNEMWFGDGPTLSTPTSGTTIFTCNVKSGTMNSSLTSAGTGDAQNSFYVGIGANYSPGHRRIEVEGGVFWSLAGGLDDNDPTDPCITYRIRGGTFKGAIYGSAANATANGIKQMIFTGGTIQGWIGAGANGTANNGGKTNGISYVYIGGRTQVVGNNDTYINGSVGGNIFGAGSGSASWTAGEMTEGSNVVIADQAYVKKNVYGGGNFGFTDKTATVYITGGTVDGRVFGGANQNKGDYTNIVMTGGHVKEGVFGGCNTSGTIGYTVTMKINGGTVGDGDSEDGVFGGGYGSSTIVTGNVTMTLGASTSAADSATVNGNVYGGSALGRTNNGNTTNTTTVTMNKALVNGNVFGGALGNGAVVNGKITVTVNGGRVNGNIFGGGDAAAYSPNSNHPIVNMTGGQATHVFGGGKGSTAAVTGNPQVTLSGTAHVTGNVYGGGDAAAVSGETNVILRD